MFRTAVVSRRVPFISLNNENLGIALENARYPAYEQIFHLSYRTHFRRCRRVCLCTLLLLGLVLHLPVRFDLGDKNTAKIHRTFVRLFMGLELFYLRCELAARQHSPIWRRAVGVELFLGGIAGSVFVVVSAPVRLFSTSFAGATGGTLPRAVDVYRILARLGVYRFPLAAIRLYPN